MGFRVSRLVNATLYWEDDAPQLHGTEAPALRSLLDHALCISSSVSSIMSFNKLLNKSKCSPRFCEPMKGFVGNFDS